jgi:tetratricopeptide (TPR) repeat protein
MFDCNSRNGLAMMVPELVATVRVVRCLRHAAIWVGMFVVAGGVCGCAPPPVAETPRETSSPPEAPPAEIPPPLPDPKVLRESLADFNRGAGFMERYQYSDAAAAFTRVLERQPDWTAARFNLALAQLNMLGQTEAKDNLEAARQGFEAILAEDPQHLPARFCMGMYYQHIGDLEQTLACFRAVYEQDPDDSHVSYKYAEALRNAGRSDEALPVLEKVVERNPGFISAVYLLATAYTRASMRDKAMPLFERFKKLNAAELTGGSFVVQATYGMAGKYYRVLGPDDLPLPSVPVPEQPRIVFSPQTRTWDVTTHRWKWPGGTVGLPGLAVADVDGDGHLDVCLAGGDQRGTAVLWRNAGDGQFTAGQTLAEGVASICAGDVDNDGHVDLWLGRAGPDQLLRNDGQGSFVPVEGAQAAALAGPDALTHLARLLDVDSDGDLDFLAFRLGQGDLPASAEARPAAWSLFGTNGDGTFADLSGEEGFEFAEQAIAAVVYDDFDNDYDMDLIVFPAQGEPVAWLNNRLGAHRLLDAATSGLQVQEVVSATSADPDKDGDRDLLVFSRAGLRLLVNQGNFRFAENAEFTAAFGPLGGTGGQFADMDNDGDLDLVLADATRRDGSRGPVLLVNTWPQPGFVNANEADPGNLLNALRTDGDASCVVADFTASGSCDVLLVPAGQAPLLIENVTPGGHWIQLDLVGKRPQDSKARSNHSAIGARVEVKTGAVFQQFVVGSSSGPTAMAPLRIHAGLGGSPTVDWLRIIWPDAVLQGEVEMVADCTTVVEQVPRKASSCPYLFAWNGEQFEFVADFGGVGGLGYLVSPGQYAPPDPTEYLPLPQLAPRDGQYVLQALTPLEEVTYFDEAKLIAIDHPQGTEVLPSELMAIGVSPPEFEVFCFERPIEPLSAVDQHGRDVTDGLRSVDRRYAGATRPDPRFLGLADPHFVELDFGDQLAKLPANARLILALHGWVEYAYSSTNFAASQAGLRPEAPTIAAQRDGQWVTLLSEVGYPAGVNHTMTVELTSLLQSSDRRLRVSSNMELYWDRIFLARHLPDAPLTLTEVAAQSADFHFRGYPREFSPDGRHPNLCDYNNLDRTVSWKLMSGNYTRFGDVAELLEAADDCYVIMGHGEELTLRFAVDSFGPVPPDCRRSFLLKADSYCKDMDLYTAYPDTLEPLPFHGMSSYPYGPDERYPDTEKTRDYRRRYNTRVITGR